MEKSVLILATLLLLGGVLFPGPVPAAGSNAMTVDDAVKTALKRNPAVQEAAESFEAAREGIKSARADRLPQVSLGYGYTALKERPIMKTAAGDVQVAHQRTYDWHLTVVQPLFTGFALDARHQIARLDADARQLEGEQARLDIVRSTKAACYQLLLSQKLLQVSDDEVTTLAAHKAEAEQFHREGLIPLNDQLRAEVALANAVQNRERVRAEVAKAVMDINRLLDLPLETHTRIQEDKTDGGLAEAWDDGFDRTALENRAAERRPLLRLLSVSLEQLGFAKRAARSDWFPQVSLVGGLAHSGENPSADRNDYSDEDESYAAVTLEWRLWRSGKTRAEVNRLGRQLRSLKARIRGHQSQVQQEVNNAILDCQVARTNIDTAEKALAQAAENWRITEIQYQNQAATSSDVLDARSFLTQADSNYFRSLYGYRNALAGLEWAVGGGLDL